MHLLIWVFVKFVSFWCVVNAYDHNRFSKLIYATQGLCIRMCFWKPGCRPQYCARCVRLSVDLKLDIQLSRKGKFEIEHGYQCQALKSNMKTRPTVLNMDCCLYWKQLFSLLNQWCSAAANNGKPLSYLVERLFSIGSCWSSFHFHSYLGLRAIAPSFAKQCVSKIIANTCKHIVYRCWIAKRKTTKIHLKNTTMRLDLKKLCAILKDMIIWRYLMIFKDILEDILRI